MTITRRDFLKYCGLSAAALGISALNLGALEKVFAAPNAPSVLWLQGSACAGCSISFLNRISGTDPKTAADVLISNINLAFHPTLMTASGDTSVAAAKQAYDAGNYILIVEGGVPTAFTGNCCWAWSYNGQPVTFKQAVIDYAARAAKVVCVGTCASFGGIAASGANPAGIQSVQTATGVSTLNIAGCPPHPDWIVWAVVELLLGHSIAVDSNGRPTSLYSGSIHDSCPRHNNTHATSYGVDNLCLRDIGCRGPSTPAKCVSNLWNNRCNWCIDANSPCLGCTRPDFPGTAFITHA